MKHIKRALALGLALALALGLAMPATAATDWSKFTILDTSPEKSFFRHGKEVMLSILLNVPQGGGGHISMVWQNGFYRG